MCEAWAPFHGRERVDGCSSGGFVFALTLFSVLRWVLHCSFELCFSGLCSARVVIQNVMCVCCCFDIYCHWSSWGGWGHTDRMQGPTLISWMSFEVESAQMFLVLPHTVFWILLDLL